VFELRKEYGENNDKYLGTIQTLNNFTNASEAEIDRLKVRMRTFDSQVRRINIRVRAFLRQDDSEYAAESINNNPENVRMSILERNVEKLIQAKLASDKNIKGLNDAQTYIRKLVMKSIGGKANDLMSALRLFQKENECEKQTILGQVDRMEKILCLGRRVETGKESVEIPAKESETDSPGTAYTPDTFHRWREIADLLHDKVVQLDYLMARLASTFKRPASNDKRAVAVVSPTIDHRNFVGMMEIDKQQKAVLPPITSPVSTPKTSRKPRLNQSDSKHRSARFFYPNAEPCSPASSTGTRSPSPAKSSLEKAGEFRLSVVEMEFPDMTAPVSSRVLKGIHVKKSDSMENNMKYDWLKLFDPKHVQRSARSSGHFVYSNSEPSHSPASSPGTTRSPSPLKSPKAFDHRLSVLDVEFPDMTASVNSRILKGIHVKKSNSMEMVKKKYDLAYFEKLAAGVAEKP
jgi:hypothetical protein